jgi:hypothetical protein
MLVPCTTCARHVRASEKVCPFCARELPANLAARATPGTNKRLTRAAFFTFATTLGAFGVLAGCNGDDSGSSDDASAGDASYATDVLYGSSYPFDANEFDSNYGLNDGSFDASDDVDVDDANDADDD